LGEGQTVVTGLGLQALAVLVVGTVGSQMSGGMRQPHLLGEYQRQGEQGAAQQAV